MLLPRHLIVIVLLMVSFHGSGQPFELNRQQLIGEWYSSNDDSLFFKADTLVLVRRSDSNVVLDRMCVAPDLARERGLLNCMEFVNLRFKARNRFEMWLYEGYSSEVWLSPMRWHLENNVITVDANEFNWTFQVFRLDTVRFFDREYSYFDKYANPRLTLLRTSPDSIIPIPLTVETVMDTLFQDSGSEVLDSLKQIQLEGILRNLKSNQRH